MGWERLGLYSCQPLQNIILVHPHALFRGIALWGGDKFGQLQKFAHFGVEVNNSF